MKYKVTIHFVGGGILVYVTKNEEEPNRIKYHLENNIPLAVVESNRTLTIPTHNILAVEEEPLEVNE